MTAFISAWRIIKGDQLYYSVHITPQTDEEAQLLWDLQNQLDWEGITFDSGGMVGAGGGRDWELDFSLKGATPEQVLERLKQTLPIERLDIQMWYQSQEEKDAEAEEDEEAERQRYAGLKAKAGDYAPQELTDKPHPVDSWIVGPPVTCPGCGADDAAMIREPSSEGGHLTVNCGKCGGIERMEDDDPYQPDYNEFGDVIDPWGDDE